MSKYAVNEPGAAALRSMASAIDEAVEQLGSLISGREIVKMLFMVRMLLRNQMD